MTIRYYVFPRSEIEAMTAYWPIPADELAKWESVRPGVLNDDQQDIFAPNCRTQLQQWHDYSLFQRVDNPDDAQCIVCQNWLEIFESNKLGMHQGNLLKHIRKTFPEKVRIWSWNHDHDCLDKFGREERWKPSHQRNHAVYSRDLWLQYNTSVVMETDFLMPFWNVETRLESKEKTQQPLGGFVGYIGRLELRNAMRQGLGGRAEWYISDSKTDETSYLAMMQEWRYALCPRGGGLSSYRLFEAIQCEAIPILFADDYAMPFTDACWGEFCIRLPQQDVGNAQVIGAAIAQFDEAKGRERLKEMRQRFSLLGVQQAVHDRVERMAWA